MPQDLRKVDSSAAAQTIAAQTITLSTVPAPRFNLKEFPVLSTTHDQSLTPSAGSHTQYWVNICNEALHNVFSDSKNTNCQMLTVNDVLTYIVVICFQYYQNCNFFKPLPTQFCVSVARGCLHVLSVSMSLSLDGIHKSLTYNFLSFITYIYISIYI